MRNLISLSQDYESSLIKTVEVFEDTNRHEYCLDLHKHKGFDFYVICKDDKVLLKHENLEFVKRKYNALKKQFAK